MTFADSLSEKMGGQSKIDLRDLAKALARAGRGKDTMLAHITPREAKVLDAIGGGDTNPQTGLPEYGEGGADAGSTGGDSGTGSSGGGPAGGSDPGTGRGGGGPAGGTAGAASGGGGEADRGGRASRGDVRGGAQGRGPGRGGTGRGGIGSSVGGGGQAGRSEVRSGTNAPGKGLGVARGGFGIGAQNAAAEAEAAENAIRDKRVRQVTGIMMGMPIDQLHDIAEVIGEGISAFGGPSAGTIGSADPNAPGVTGVAGPADVSGGESPPGEPLALPGLERPEEIPFPQFLGISDAMTPLQQRAKIATFGTAGEVGGFRGPEAQEVYKNILLRSILGDENQVLPGSQILPVEAQYAQQALGSDVSQDMSVESFARTLMGLPPAPSAIDTEPEINTFGGR